MDVLHRVVGASGRDRRGSPRGWTSRPLACGLGAIVALLAIAAFTVGPPGARARSMPTRTAPSPALAEIFHRCGELTPPSGWSFTTEAWHPAPNQIFVVYDNGSWKNMGEDPATGYGDILCSYRLGVATKSGPALVDLDIAVDHGCLITWPSDTPLDAYRAWSGAGANSGHWPSSWVKSAGGATAQTIEPTPNADGSPGPQTQVDWLVYPPTRTSMAAIFTENSWSPSVDPGYAPILPVAFAGWANALAASTEPYQPGLLGSCPGATVPTAAPSASPGGLAVELQCESNNPDPGLVLCTAASIGAGPDAAISYEWTYDGAPQPELSAQLQLTGVPPGHHDVTVVAHDSGTDERSSPALADFEKQVGQAAEVGPDDAIGPLNPYGEGAPPPGSETTPRNGSDGPSPILVLLGASIFIAIGGVIVARVVNGKPVPVTPQAMPPAAVPVGPARRGSDREPGAGWGVPPGPPASIAVPADITTIAGAAPPPVLASEPQGIGPFAPAPPSDDAPPAPSEQGTPPPSAPATPPVVATAATPPRDGGEGPTEGPRSTELYRFDVVTPSVTVSGAGRRAAEVRVRVVEVATNREAPDAVPFVGVVRSDERVEYQREGANLTLRVWARHIGPGRIASTFTFTGVCTGGVPLAPATALVTVEPAAIAIRIIAWKKGFEYQDVSQSIARPCAFLRGRVVASRREIAEPKVGAPGSATTGRAATSPADLLPVIDALCRCRVRVGDGNWTDPIDVRTDEAGQFELMLPAAWTQKFGGSGVTEQLLHPVQVHLHRDVQAQLAALRKAIRALPLTNEYHAARSDCETYPATFFRQLCDRGEAVYDETIGCLELLRATAVFVGRYRKDFVDQRVLTRRAFNSALQSIAFLLVFTSGFAGKLYDWVGTGLAPAIRSIGSWAEARGPAVRLLLRLCLAPLTAAMWTAERVVGWALCRLGDLGRRIGIVTLSHEELEAGLSAAAEGAKQQAAAWSAGQSPAQAGAGSAASVLFGLFGKLIALFEMLRWTLRNIVTRGAGGCVKVACNFVADALGAFWGAVIEGTEAAGEITGWPAIVYKKQIYKRVDPWLRDFGLLVDRKIAEWCTTTGATGVTGTEPSVTLDLGEALVSLGPSIEQMDAIGAQAMQTALAWSIDRRISGDWQAAIHRAALAQAAFLADWARAEFFTECAEWVDRWILANGKLLVQGASWYFAIEAYALWGGVGYIARKIAEDRAKVGWTVDDGLEPLQTPAEILKQGDVAGKAIDAVQALVYLSIAVKEYASLAATKAGLPTMIQILYHGKPDEDLVSAPAVIAARTELHADEITGELERQTDGPVDG